MKKVLTKIGAIVIAVTMLAGCSAKETVKDSNTGSDSNQTVTTAPTETSKEKVSISVNLHF